MGAQQLPFRSVLCPTDLSPDSSKALDLAASLCGATGAELTVVHVHPRELPMAAEFSYLSPPPLEEVERAEIAAKLDALAAPVRATGVRARTRVLEGDPAFEVARLARALEADLVVVGFHSEARLRHLLMGSTAEELVRRAGCPVLVVPAKAPTRGGQARRATSRRTVEA
jgi:universal stress protein A